MEKKGKEKENKFGKIEKKLRKCSGFLILHPFYI
jgi:hypothetical protein